MSTSPHTSLALSDAPNDAETIGYRKPPKSGQFCKGQSGNPNGRPCKAQARPKARNSDFGARPANNLLLEELYRPVKVREGEQVLEMPALQAVFRAMGVSAMKGNRFAQRALAEMVQKIEEEDRQEKYQAFETWFLYKRNATEAIEQARAYGHPEPKLIPHPDDVIIDPYKGTVNFAGPLMPDQKARWDDMLARRAESQSAVNDYAARHRRARDPKTKAFWLEQWHNEQTIFDLINDSMPQRYKATLANRSHHPDASCEGKTLEAYMKEQKRQRKRQRPT